MKKLTIYDPDNPINDDLDLYYAMKDADIEYDNYLIGYLQICEDEVRLLNLYYSYIAGQFLLSSDENDSIVNGIKRFKYLAIKHCKIEVPQLINLYTVYWELKDLQDKHFDLFKNPEMLD